MRGAGKSWAWLCVAGALLCCTCSSDGSPESIGVATEPLSNIGAADGCGPTGSCYAGLLGGPWANVPLPAKVLSLTIDDGPGDFGADISTYLAGLPVPIRAAFFDNGNRFVTSTDLPNENNIAVTAGADSIVQQILAQGHLIANHTVTHRDMATDVLPAGPTQVFNELAETDQDLAGYFPSGFYLFRAPYGDFNPDDYSALAGTAMNKYVGPVYWDIGGVSTNYPDQAADWACWQGQITCGSVDAALGCPSVGALAYGTGYLTTKQCGDAYLKDVATFGAGIILTHDPYSWAKGNTLAMLQYILPILQADGYTFIRVDDVPEVRALLPPCDPSCTSCTGVTADQCRACAAGRYLSGTSCPLCDTCALGTYETAACTSTADTQCASCDPSCASCTGMGANACGTCVAGRYLSGTGCPLCDTCGPGTYQAVACTTTADTKCATCDPTCSTCSGAGPSACTACATATFLTAGACQACSVCPPGSIQTAACTATSDATCAACSPGSYASDAGLACLTCAAGSFAADAGSPACVPCAPGTSASTGQAACTSCLAGQVSDGGAAMCSTCPAGSAAPSDSAECQPCAAGTFAAAGAGACTACPAGTAAPASAAACTACAPGSASSAGMSTCSSCAAGTSASGPGATTCAPCAAGTYATGAGAATCASCGSCDDGDGCTSDECSSVVGCTHTPIPGCASDAGAPLTPIDAGSDAVSSAKAGTGMDASPATGGDAGKTAPTTLDAGARSADGAAASVGASGGCAVASGSPVDGGFVAGGAFVVFAWRRRRSRAEHSSRL